MVSPRSTPGGAARDDAVDDPRGARVPAGGGPGAGFASPVLFPGARPGYDEGREVG